MTIPDNMNDPAMVKGAQGEGKREIDTLYIHYSASGDLGNAAQSRAIIDRWHKDRRPPFWMIGYHGGTTPRGERFIGRPDSMVGAHVKYHNAYSLGFVVIGDDLGDTPWFPTAAQYEDAAAWCREKMAKYNIPLNRVLGHRDSNPTSCPGPFDVHGKLKERLREKPQPPEEDDMGSMNVATSGVPVKYMAYHGFLGPNPGQGVVEDVYAKVSNKGRKSARVTFTATGSKLETITHAVEPGGYKEVRCSEFLLTGPVLLEVESSRPVLISFDHRGKDV